MATSNYYKVKKYDNLLNLSYQECTTSSGYILNKKTANKVLKILKFGLENILSSNNPGVYCCDRIWSKIQKDDKFYTFRKKIGFQRPNYSNITNVANCHFD